MAEDHDGGSPPVSDPSPTDEEGMASESAAPTRPKPLRAPWTPIDLLALSALKPEPTRWIISGWLPAGYATLLAGHGDAGKSMVALQGAVSVALGRQFFGVSTEQRRVAYIACEDREVDLHRRLDGICRAMGVSLADLAGELDLVDMVGQNPRLSSDGAAALSASVVGRRVELLIVDGVADTFDGDENDRGDVKRFVNRLLSLVPNDGAVLLIGHVAKTDLDGRPGHARHGYGGTTGWHNSVRSRWFLIRDGERRTLSLEKSNLGGPVNSVMHLEWRDGAFHGGRVIGPSEEDRRAQDDSERKALIEAVRGCVRNGITVPTASGGSGRTAFLTLKLRPEFPKTLLRPRENRKRFNELLEQALQRGEVRVEEYRNDNRKLKTCYVVGDAPVRQCAKPETGAEQAQAAPGAPAPVRHSGPGVQGGGVRVKRQRKGRQSPDLPQPFSQDGSANG
jgi:hypothetical protein